MPKEVAATTDTSTTPGRPRSRRCDAGLPNPIEDEALAWTGALIGSGIGGINTMIRDVIEAPPRASSASARSW